MFLKYLDFVFQPFRNINNKILGVKNIKGNFVVDVNRSKALMNRGKQFAGEASTFNQNLNAKAGQVGAQAQQFGQGGQAQQQGQQGAPQMQQGPAGGMQMQQMQQGGMGGGMQGGAPGMSNAPGGGGLPNGNPAIITKGWWIFKKKFCSQCEQQLDKTWDACPYCQQIAQQAADAPQKKAMKTQAFMMDSTGGPGSAQLLGWLVPLQGPQRGELFTLAPQTLIGTEPKCTIVLNDKFMSSQHAEINAENGMWILRDKASTNGTYVNNRRVDRHELVDNDFIKFGSAMLKFKSL